MERSIAPLNIQYRRRYGRLCCRNSSSSVVVVISISSFVRSSWQNYSFRHKPRKRKALYFSENLTEEERYNTIICLLWEKDKNFWIAHTKKFTLHFSFRIFLLAAQLCTLRWINKFDETDALNFKTLTTIRDRIVPPS